MPSKSFGDHPLVDRSVLRDLAEQFENPAAAGAFAADFIKVWEERYAKLSAAIAACDEVASLDSILSVKITSMMVGATRMAAMAVDLEDSIRRADMDRAAGALPALEDCGIQTVRQLRLHL